VLEVSKRKAVVAVYFVMVKQQPSRKQRSGSNITAVMLDINPVFLIIIIMAVNDKKKSEECTLFIVVLLF
jgi:hypothetical protein